MMTYKVGLLILKKRRLVNQCRKRTAYVQWRLTEAYEKITTTLTIHVTAASPKLTAIAEESNSC